MKSLFSEQYLGRRTTSAVGTSDCKYISLSYANLSEIIKQYPNSFELLKNYHTDQFDPINQDDIENTKRTFYTFQHNPYPGIIVLKKQGKV